MHTIEGKSQLAFFKQEIIQSKFSTKEDNVLLTPFPLLLLNSFISLFLFDFMTHINPTSTPHGSYIDPHIDPISIVHQPHIDPTLTFPFITVYFLLFKLISVVDMRSYIQPPSPHFLFSLYHQHTISISNVFRIQDIVETRLNKVHTYFIATSLKGLFRNNNYITLFIITNYNALNLTKKYLQKYLKAGSSKIL